MCEQLLAGLTAFDRFHDIEWKCLPWSEALLWPLGYGRFILKSYRTER